MHQQMAAALDTMWRRLRAIQEAAREGGKTERPSGR